MRRTRLVKMHSVLNFLSKSRKSCPSKTWVCPSERETRQSCSSLALPHKPTRPDSPDPIWRAGSWFSMLEAIVITVSRGTGYITARRCSYYTIIFTVQLHTVHTMHTPQYTFVFDWGWFEVISTGNGPRCTFPGTIVLSGGRQWIGSPNRVQPLHILKYFGPQKKVSIISFEWYISMSLGLIPVGNKQNMR